MATTQPSVPKDKASLSSRDTGHAQAERSPPERGQASGVDVAALSDEALSAVIAEAQDEQERRQRQREAEFLENMRAQASALRIAPARLVAMLGGKTAARTPTGGKPDGRSVVKAKFWNPDDHAQRWAGRGAPPKWYAAHLAAGGTEADLRIPEGEG